MAVRNAKMISGERATIRSVPGWVLILSGITALILAVAASRLSLYRPINADEAYNLQIAKSIGTHFCYCTRYFPERVFPVEESTNGIAQYVGGTFFALTHSPDSTIAATTAAAMLALGAALLLLDPWLVLLAALLFLNWYALVYVSVNFLGELWAIAFILFGIFALRKCDFSTSLGRLLKSRPAIFAIVYFAIATESKLLAVLVIVPVIYAVAYQRFGAGTLGARALRAGFVTLAMGFGTAITLLFLIAFSVIHSMRTVSIGAIWQTFTGYLFNMAGQGQGQAQTLDVSHALSIITHFSSPSVAVLFILSAALLLYANWTYAFFLAVTLIWWLHYGVNERHVVISLFVTIVLAGLEAHALIKRLGAGREMLRVKLSLAASAALAGIVLLTGVASGSAFDAPANVRPVPHRAHLVRTSQGWLRYRTRLVDLLRRKRYVVTSGWFQFSELTLRENLEFYDRMSPANARLPRAEAVLFFDKGFKRWWPVTSVKGNCGRVLYTQGPLVVCTVKRGVPLDFQPAP